MSFSTLTLASIYELQGLREDALRVYQEILEREPGNTEARAGIIRLSGMRKKYEGVNQEMKEFFISMETPVEFAEFERWLLRLWN
ncbi:MAG: tetratricopeptide repeat protein [Campylobacterales bacterium]